MPEEARYGDVAFTLAGKSYAVRYGNLAWDRIKTTLGVSNPAAGIALAMGGNDAARDAILLGGLLAYHKTITADDVRALYDEIPKEGERSLWSACWEAIGVSLPEFKKRMEAALAGPKADVANPSPKPPKRTGRRR